MSSCEDALDDRLSCRSSNVERLQAGVEFRDGNVCNGLAVRSPSLDRVRRTEHAAPKVPHSSVTRRSADTAIRRSRQARWPARAPAAGIDAASMARRCQRNLKNRDDFFSTCRAGCAGGWAGAWIAGEPSVRGTSCRRASGGVERDPLALRGPIKATGPSETSPRRQASRRAEPLPSLALAYQRRARSDSTTSATSARREQSAPPRIAVQPTRRGR